MTSSFYINLPSNARGENNKTSSFCVHLPKKLEFNSQWTVGLTNIIYPFSWSNLGLDELQSIDIKWKNGAKTRFYIPTMIYRNYTDLLSSLQSAFQEGAKRLCKIKEQAESLPNQRSKRDTAEEFNFNSVREYDELIRSEREILAKLAKDKTDFIKDKQNLLRVTPESKKFYTKQRKLIKKLLKKMLKNFYISKELTQYTEMLRENFEK